MALACIVFDCDGVVLENVDAKTLAFRKTCREFAPAFAEEFAEYAALHGGISRHEKFAWLVRKAFGRDIAPEEARRMAESFSRHYDEAAVSTPLVPGFLETAERRLGKTPMFVASGAPHYALVAVLTELGLDRYFAGMYGSPPGKAALLASIVKGAGVSPRETVMVGDSKTDRDAALIVGTHFYGRGSFFKNGPHPWGPDLFNLNAYLETLDDDDGM